MENEKLLEFYNHFKDWYNTKVEQLTLLRDSDVDLQLEGKDGKKIVFEANSEVAQGIRLGASIAIDTIGKFPVKLSTETEN